MASFKVPPPVFSEDCLYSDWKVDVDLWSRSILDSQLNKKQKSIVLYQSLPTTVRKTVLSTVTIENIDHDDGIKNILTAMDSFYKKDQVRSGCTEIKKLLKYRRPKSMAMDKFFIEINLMMNKVENLGVTIPDAFKAVIMLDCANLSESKTELCHATCTALTVNDMRAQIEKVGYDVDSNTETTAQSSSTQGFAVIKTEPAIETMYVQNCLHCGQDSVLSSEEESYPNETFYSNKSSRNGLKWNQKRLSSNRNQPYSARRAVKNPQNRFGYYTTCDFCKCTYHYLPDCPYCPEEIKLEHNLKKQAKIGRGRQNHPTF